MLLITSTSIGHLFAYIDPASGSIILQVILAGAVGALGYFFRPIMRAYRFLTGRGSKPAEPAADPEKTADEPPTD